MELVWIKTKAVLALVGGIIVAFLIPLIPFLGMVFVLVFVDLLTGIRAARKRKEDITSGGMKRTIEKITLYFAAIMLSEGMSQVFFAGAPITYVVATYIALTEFKSNIENISTVTGIDLWKKIVSKIGLGRWLGDKAENVLPKEAEQDNPAQPKNENEKL